MEEAKPDVATLFHVEMPIKIEPLEQLPAIQYPYAKKYKSLIHSTEEIKNPFKRSSGKVINRELRRCVLSVHFQLTRRPKEQRSYTEIAAETAELLGISLKSVLNILKTGPDVETPKKNQNRKKKSAQPCKKV